jgi:hypothetical protein
MLGAIPRCHLDRELYRHAKQVLSIIRISHIQHDPASSHRSIHGFREEALHITTDYDSVDYFTDPSLVPDPHPYFDYLRTKNPVGCPIHNGFPAVTGWEEANAV